MRIRTVSSASLNADTDTAAQPLVWSVSDAARMLGISRAFAYELIASGKLPHVRLGRRVVVPRRVVEALIDAAVETRAEQSDPFTGSGFDTSSQRRFV